MQTAGCGEPIILVHGFGLSAFHYRKQLVELSKKYKVGWQGGLGARWAPLGLDPYTPGWGGDWAQGRRGRWTCLCVWLCGAGRGRKGHQ